MRYPVLLSLGLIGGAMAFAAFWDWVASWFNTEKRYLDDDRSVW